MVAVSSYRGCIGHSGPTAPTSDTLRVVHHAQLQTVPFENLDIALGRKIVVDQDAFIRKVVEQRRGGFCYELNGGFAGLLRALGFRVTMFRRGWPETRRESAEFDHLARGVDLEEPWLADVGFGESFLEPLRIEVGQVQVDPAGTFRLAQLGERLQLDKVDPEGQWKRQYLFALEPRSLNEFAGRCHYHQASPESHFTQNRICTSRRTNFTFRNEGDCDPPWPPRREVAVFREEGQHTGRALRGQVAGRRRSKRPIG